MSRFFYRVRTGNGKILQDYISASSITDAALKLEHKGYNVLEIREESENKSQLNNFSQNKIISLTLQEKKEFFNSFYYLYKSGLSVFEIFKSIYNSSKNSGIKSLCAKIVRGVEQGKSLKDSMKNCFNALGLAYTMIIAAGEESGKLEENLSSIIKNLTRQEEIKSNLISSLTYPVSIFFLAIAVGLIFKFFVFEIFAWQASDSGNINIMGVAFIAIIKILIIFTLIFAILFLIYKNKNIQRKIINFIMNTGIFGNILKNYCFSNFFSVFAMAYESGIPASEAVELANSVVDIPEIHKKIKKSETMVQNGCEIATALGVTGLFSGYAVSQISAGEKAGELDKMLKTVARDYENRLDTSIKVILKLVGPLMLILVGIFVAVIVVNAYKAYYNSILSMF